MSEVAQQRSWRSARPVHLVATLVGFRRGGADPTFRLTAGGSVVRGIRTPAGPATIELDCAPKESEISARAWGSGAGWAVEHAPDLIGESDDPGGFVPLHPPVAQAARRFSGWRVPRSGLVLDALVPAIIEQKVTGREAFGGYQHLVRRFGERAPGPWGEAGLLVPPDVAGWRAIPNWEWLGADVDGARSGTIQRVCRVADSLERLADGRPGDAARAGLRSVPGVGVWTAAEVAQRALGDADAVSFGDYHVARNIGWALIGEELDDDGLADLLAPYAGHRFRVQRLLELAGHQRPRRGARMAPRTHLPRVGGRASPGTR